MPRNDDRDDFDDRPRRRRSSSGGNTTWIILGVVGGVILLFTAICAGLVYAVVFKTGQAANQFAQNINQAGQAVNQFTQQFAGMAAAEAFCEDLKSNRATNAYNSTSKNFQAGKSRAQFDQLLAQHPALTQHQHRSVVSFNTVGQAPNQQVVVKIRLHTQPQFNGPNDPADPEEDAPPQTKKKKAVSSGKQTTVPTGKGGKPAKPLEDLDVTLTMVDEGGVWKVDQITIP
jgi:hypothetical protein